MRKIVRLIQENMKEFKKNSRFTFVIFSLKLSQTTQVCIKTYHLDFHTLFIMTIKRYFLYYIYYLKNQYWKVIKSTKQTTNLPVLCYRDIILANNLKKLQTFKFITLNHERKLSYLRTQNQTTTHISKINKIFKLRSRFKKSQFQPKNVKVKPKKIQKFKKKRWLQNTEKIKLGKHQLLEEYSLNQNRYTYTFKTFYQSINLLILLINQTTRMSSAFNSFIVLLIIQYSLLNVQTASTPMAIIAQSGTNTIITSPSPPVNATVVAYKYPRNITQNPAAKWIWYGPGNNTECPMQITVTQSFTMKCLNQPLYFYVAADNYYTATIGNYTLTGSDWSSPNSYTLSTTGLACGTQLTWTIVATNLPNSANLNCSKNPAGLIFSILSPDCPCKSSSYTYDSQTCACSPCNKTLIGCSTCSSSTVCTTCNTTLNFNSSPSNGTCVRKSGYYIITGCTCASKTTLCPDNCTCNTFGYFIKVSGKCVCASGYVLNGAQCQTCSTFMTACTICSSTTTCESCSNTNYTLVNSICQTCASLLTNCKTCSSSSICTSCVSTSYAVQNDICVNCGSIMTGCLTCSSSSVCLTCDTADYFYLDSNVCKCNSGYALNGLNCQYCNVTLTNCISCSSTTVCSQCQNTSYTVNNSICTLCSTLNSICLTCTSPSYCTTCDTTQNYNSIAVSGICECQSGYTLDSGSCTLCSSLINGCSTCISSNVCTTCSTILNFNPTPNLANTCDCATTFIFDTNNDCVLCSLTLPNCNTCTSQSVCTSCNNNYVLDNTGACIPCSSIMIGCSSCNLTNCLSCDSIEGFNATVDGGGIITSCTCVNDSYYFDGNTCNFCNPQFAGCSECQILTSNPLSLNCSQCLDSYYSTLTISIITSCSACSTISAGCITCSTGPICNTCDATLFYNPTPNGNTCECVNSSYVYIPLSNCVACNTINALGSCSQCSSTSICTACINNAYAIDTNNVCTACSTLITGCLTCDSSTNCLTCDLTDYVPSGLNPNTCICNSISTMNNSVCTLCSSLISNCIACSNYQTCTTCISLYTNSSGNCILCSQILALGPCINCSSTTTCTLCQADYFPDNSGVCQPCSYYMTNCTSCSSNNTCLTCDTGFGVEPNNNNLCSPCSGFMIGCLQCSSSQTCTNCDFDGFFVQNSNNSCSCVDSLLYYNSTCMTCTQLLPNCISCTSSTVCTDCLDGYYINQNNNCQVCEYGCLICNLTNGCSYCDPTMPTSLIIDSNNYGSCGCATGYVLNTADPNNNYCQSTCGDGYLISPDEQCDDNNLINGDGCSSLCVVQTNYTCTNNPVDLSVCSYNQPLSIAIQSIVKQPNSNTITFTMQIGPNISSLNSVNFSNIISSNVSLSNPIYTYSPNGTLTISYNYNSTLQGQPAQFTIDPTLAGSNFSQSSPSNLTVKLVSSNNLPIAFYNQSVYDDSKKFKDAYLAAQVISYIILAAGMACNKIVGVQLFGALQVAFFSVSTINQVQPLLQPIRQLKTVNGINSQFNFNSSSVPDRVKGIGYQAPFLSNFNYMFWLVIGQIFTGVSFIIAGKLISSFSQKLENIGKKMLKEYLLMLALFNILNISYSAGLQFTYDDTLFSANSAIAVLAMVVPVVIGLVYTFSPSDNDDFGQFKSYFKPNYVCKSYFLFTIVYRAILGICMSQMNEIEQATIITFIISMFYFMFLISNLPFKKGYQNYRTVICQISVMISLFISMYYRSMKSTTNPSISSQILSPAFLQMLGIFSSVSVSLMCLCYELYLKYLKKSPSPQTKQKFSNLNKRGNNNDNPSFNLTHQNIHASVDDQMIQNIQ